MIFATRLMAPTLLAALLAASAAHAAGWSVDPAKSTIRFAGMASGEAFSGSFKTFTATIDFDPAAPQGGHALVVVDTASAGTGDAQKDELMPSADFFDVSAFPKATFEAKGFKPLGDARYQADGTLTIRDKVLPVTLPFQFTQTGTTAHAVGSVELKRQDYGVGQNAWAADDNVASAVTVTIDLFATGK